MKKGVLLPFMATWLLMGCGGPKEEPLKELASHSTKAVNASVQRGAYLVNAIGCADCHSPKVMNEHGPEADPARNLSGHPENEPLPPLFEKPFEGVILFNMHGTASKGPWGISFSANITPHETGIGNWTEEQFLLSIKKGKFKGLEGSRDLLPLMPWHFYRNFTDNDLKSMFGYLKTLQPVENVVPPAIPPPGV
jgi:hypothetical protein